MQILPNSKLYTRKINPIFSDIPNQISDSEVAAIDMMNFEWSYSFYRSQINFLFVVSFIFLGDIGEIKLIREATLKHHISGSLRGDMGWNRLGLNLIKKASNAFYVYTCLSGQGIMVKRVESDI